MSHDATVRRTVAGNADPARPEGDAPAAEASGHPQEFAVGQVVRERYELVEVLGRGAMGTVFLAKDLIEERYEERNPYVAIKCLGSEFSSHPQAKIALERESRKARNLSHDNIVKVFYFDECGDTPYMVMELMRGTPLDDLIRERQGGLPFDEAWPIVRDMCLGLAYIHSQGMVHSDFKPNNVFVAEDGTAKILDLGIARASVQSRKDDDKTRFDASTLGALTPAYASCEMFEGQDPDPRDDLYALGCVVYELLTGRHPYNRASSIEARKRRLTVERIEGLIEDRRWRALERALALVREDRTASVEAFLEELEAKRDFSKRRLAVVGVTSAVAASLVAAWLIPEPNPDDAFVNALLETAGAQTLDGERETRIANWIAQGNDYIGFARDAFASLNAAAGHRDLRGGADNAERAFRSVLELTPSEEAARGVLAIVNTYADGAEQLAAQGDRADALWLACQGYQVHPNHARLGRQVTDFAAAGSDTNVDFGRTCREVLSR